MSELNNKIQATLNEILRHHDHKADAHSLDVQAIQALITEQVRLGKDEVLDELLEWHEKAFWSDQHEKPFNWYGAVKALKVSKDFKKPFNVLSTTDTTLLEGEK